MFHVLPHGSGKNVFPTFVTYLKSKQADDNSKENLVKELAALNEHLQKSVSNIDILRTLEILFRDLSSFC